MSDRPRWCPDCEVLGSGSDRCWMCGRLLEPSSEQDRVVSRMKDLLGVDDGESESVVGTGTRERSDHVVGSPSESSGGSSPRAKAHPESAR